MLIIINFILHRYEVYYKMKNAFIRKLIGSKVYSIEGPTKGIATHKAFEYFQQNFISFRQKKFHRLMRRLKILNHMILFLCNILIT